MFGWVEQTIADEGEVKYHKKKYRRSIIWRRSVDISDVLSGKIKETSIRQLPKAIQKIVEKKKCNLIEDELKMLNILGIDYDLYNLGIYSTKKGKVRTKWQITITKRENLLNLRKIIKIPHKEKDKKFSLMLKEFTRYLEPIKIKNTIKRIIKRKGFVASAELKKEMNYKNTGTACIWIRRLEKEGFLRCIKQSIYSENHREPARYIIPNKLQVS